MDCFEMKKELDIHVKGEDILKDRKTDVTILVNSCDKYEDAWEPFFSLLKIQWPTCPYQIVLSTESKEYHCNLFNVQTVCANAEMSWSSRLKNTLKQIDTEYILFFLEDFFLLKNVKTDVFEAALKLLRRRNDICLVEFPSIEPNYSQINMQDIDFNKTFRCVKRGEPYRAKVMVSLWRKQDFERLIFDDENPWVCEKETSLRSIVYGKKIYRQDYRYSLPTFYYCINPKMGYGITGGKWLKNNKTFFERQGIENVNYSNLGIEENAQTYKQLEEKRQIANKNNWESIKQISDSKQKCREILYMLKRKIFRTMRVDTLKKLVKYWLYYRKR